jgi:ABC-2 type transport system permease protein
MSAVSLQRVRTVVRKEMREFRRNRFVIVTMAVLPLVFLITPLVTIFRIPASASGPQVKAAVGVISLLMFIIPVALPPVIASYSVVGERDQGTLEPVLTAPVRASELLLGKAAAAFIPSVGVAYAIYLVVLISVRFGAARVVSDVVWHPAQLLAQLLFTPLLALWAIWVGIGISTRASDVRVAQQLATLASLPLLGFTSLISFQVITPSVPLAVGLALGLLVVDVAAWRFVSQAGTAEARHRKRPPDKPAGSRNPGRTGQWPALSIASLTFAAVSAPCDAGRHACTTRKTRGECTSMPCACTISTDRPPCAVGSGKRARPWLRMHLANDSSSASWVRVCSADWPPPFVGSR